MTELALSDLQVAWTLLDPPTGRELNSYRLVTRGNDIRLALDKSGARHLLVEVTGDPFQTGTGQHLVESLRSLAFGGMPRNYLDVAVADPNLMPHFDSLIVDVMGGEEEVSALVVHKALERWRTLFRLLALHRMSPERVIGLAGELVVLQRFLEAGAGGTVAWTGPAGRPHDFETRAACIEVKSMTRRSRGVTVHGLTQLEVDRDVPLYMVVCVFEEVEGAPPMSDRISAVRAMSTDVITFDEALLRSGWTQASAPGPCLDLLEALVIEIDESFPRIRPTSAGGVPSGVVDADYVLDIEKLRSLAVPSSLETMVSGMSS